MLIELADGVLNITIDRPDSLNSVNPGVLARMAEALEFSVGDARVRVVALRASGRAFCSGADIGARGSGDDHVPIETLLQANRVVQAIVSHPRPVVAVVPGATAGVGVALALACDLVVASDKAFFLLAFTKIGLMPDGGSTALVAACVGRARALKMALLADRMPASEALQCGLIGAVFPADELETEAAAIITRLRNGPAVALARTKRAVNAATLDQLDGALAREAAGQHILLEADDVREGKRAFQEKRAPVFTDL
ncbi:enoyl-CoA hydratase [Mycolicibacterium fortuitum]|uniref:enoyl-CoA hydratase n=1 Tax=Mycolicibacterium fortuitum TaxID=1766 RepID=UPI001F355E69|nr:enoyl-CoA hydratase [Mycolicibacterium fortuitum]